MDNTVDSFCSLLVRSKLRSAEAVKSVRQRWQAEARDGAGNVHNFARWLVAKQVVTEYQAALLLKGRTEDFFLNQYQILDRLGRGRMAGVFKAVHSSGQIVAIKVLPPSRAKEAEMLGRFKREAQLAMKLKHPNVVRAFQTGKARGLNFLVMEYLEGETLEETLQRRKALPNLEAVRLIHQAFMGLQHIHEMNMVHRDLKPANLMLIYPPAKSEVDNTLRATIKILDIGLGREFFDEDEQNHNADLTTEGTILGTPEYLAPEQARDSRKIDIRADIYSLGCVLFHMLTGQPPFPDKNLLKQMVRHATETPRALKEFNPAIPDGLQQIMNMMLAKQPAQRYETPEHAAKALQAFLQGDTEPARRDDAPAMKNYLSWLEAMPESVEVEMPAGAIPIAVAVPVTGKAPMAALAKPGASAVPVAVPAKVPVANAVPVASPVGIRADAIDVELVPVTPPPAGNKWLSHRDLILLGSGAAVIGVIILTILILIIVMRS